MLQQKEVPQRAKANVRSRQSFSDIGIDEADLLRADLRARLADILGPVGGANGDVEVDEDAWTTVERYGGAHCCFGRFLRARNLNLAEAERMIRDTIAFRKEVGANDVSELPGFKAEWESLRPFWPGKAVLFSRHGGHVVFLFRMAYMLRFWTLGIAEERIRCFYLAWMERALRCQREARRRLGRVEGEMPSCIEVYDLQGIGMAHLRCIAGVRLMSRILSIGQMHYPENLHKAVIVNVPYGVDAAFPIVRRVLSERTLEKILLPRGNGRQELQESLGMEPVEVDRLFESLPRYDHNRTSLISSADDAQRIGSEEGVEDLFDFCQGS